MEDEFICSANAEVRCVFLTSRSSWLEWYAQRPAYRGLRSCSTINMFIYFTSLEYLEKQTKLEEEEVRTEKAGKQFHLKTTGATKKNPDSLCQWVCGNLIYCIMTETLLKFTFLGSTFILRSLSLKGSPVSNTLTLYFAYMVDPRK